MLLEEGIYVIAFCYPVVPEVKILTSSDMDNKGPKCSEPILNFNFREKLEFEFKSQPLILMNKLTKLSRPSLDVGKLLESLTNSSNLKFLS